MSLEILMVKYQTSKENNMFKTIARFTTRIENEENQAGTIIGACIKDQDLLKANHIYEIQDILGVLTIVDLGESTLTKADWTHTIDNVMLTHGTGMLLTKEECKEKYGTL